MPAQACVVLKGTVLTTVSGRARPRAAVVRAAAPDSAAFQLATLSPPSLSAERPRWARRGNAGWSNRASRQECVFEST
eukprot:4389752-Pleurochrysis_carterae.AAC.5